MLPPLVGCVAFQSKENDNKYLRYVHESEEEAHKLLHMSGEDALNPFTRFCVEPSREHDGLVHVRCCYNNKYWVAREVDGKWWVHGDANEPVEDPSNPCCTLFKPILTADDEDSLACSLIHVQLGKETLMFTGTKAEEADHVKGRRSCLRVQAAGDADAAIAMFAVSKQDGAVLPRNVCFMGDNKMFLRGVVRQGYPYLEYSSNDMAASDVRNVTETRNDGRVRIWSVRFGKYWRRSPNWIWADANSDSWGNPDTQFRVVQVGAGDGDGDFFALRNLGNNNFCKRLTTEGKESCLNAAADSITREARMRIRETVFSRTIDEVEYQVKDARIYGQRVLTVDSAEGANITTDSSTKLSLSFKKVTTGQRSWNSSVTLKLGVSTAISAGIPLLAEGKITVSSEFSGSYSWGTTIQESQESSVTYQVDVPPMTKVTVTLLATQAKYDVPFYYRQKDILTDGTTQTSNLRDGIYTGANAYNFKFEITKVEKL